MLVNRLPGDADWSVSGRALGQLLHGRGERGRQVARDAQELCRQQPPQAQRPQDDSGPRLNAEAAAAARRRPAGVAHDDGPPRDRRMRARSLLRPRSLRASASLTRPRQGTNPGGGCQRLPAAAGSSRNVVRCAMFGVRGPVPGPRSAAAKTQGRPCGRAVRRAAAHARALGEDSEEALGLSELAMGHLRWPHRGRERAAPPTIIAAIVRNRYVSERFPIFPGAPRLLSRRGSPGPLRRPYTQAAPAWMVRHVSVTSPAGAHLHRHAMRQRASAGSPRLRSPPPMPRLGSGHPGTGAAARKRGRRAAHARRRCRRGPRHRGCRATPSLNRVLQREIRVTEQEGA